MLDEKFHRDIVDNDCADNGEKIAEHLAPDIYMGGAKGDISVEPETGKECYREDDSKICGEITTKPKSTNCLATMKL